MIASGGVTITLDTAPIVSLLLVVVGALFFLSVMVSSAADKIVRAIRSLQPSEPDEDASE